MKILYSLFLTAFFFLAAERVSAQSAPKSDTVKVQKAKKKKGSSSSDESAPAGIIIDERGTGKAHTSGSHSAREGRKDSANNAKKEEDPKPKID